MRDEKISTGFEPLDKLLAGGIPKGRCIQICGLPGSGKTLLCLQLALKMLNSHETGFVYWIGREGCIIK